MTGLGCCCGAEGLQNPLLARLCAEHDTILDLSNQLASRSAGKAELDRLVACQLQSKLRTILLSHHTLEERQLFPMIARMAPDTIQLVQEHRAGEDLLDQILSALRRGDMATAATLSSRLDAALRDHIQHESRIFVQLDKAD